MLFLSKIGAKTLVNIGDVSPQVNDLDPLKLIHRQVFTLNYVFIGLILLDAKEVTLAGPEDKEVRLLLSKVFLTFVKEKRAMDCRDQINLRLDEIFYVAFGLF